MTRTFIQTDTHTEDLTRHADPVDAEAAYWRAVVRRTDGPAAFAVAPGTGHDLILDGGRYRLDRDWHGPREQDMGRWRRYWALPLERGADAWPGVEPHHIRGLLAAAGWSQGHAASVLGVDPRTVRRWVAGGEGRAVMDYRTWVVLRDAALVAIEERAQAPAPPQGVVEKARARLGDRFDQLGLVPDAEIADAAGLTRQRIAQIRGALGIVAPPVRGKGTVGHE